MNVYLRAAQIVERDGGGACYAIERVLGRTKCVKWSSEAGTFKKLFSPTEKDRLDGTAENFCWIYWLQVWGESTAETRHRRVIALCLMAAITDYKKRRS